MYNIGDNISGIIKKIIPRTKSTDKSKIIVDINNPSWTCSLQWNMKVATEVKLFKEGSQVEGWIIRKHEQNRFIAMGISNFGRILPKSNTIAKYIDNLVRFKGILKVVQFPEFSINDIQPEIISEVKGLLNRCVKKDQWDWLFLYKGFGFLDDIEAIKLRDIVTKIRDSIRQFRKGKNIEDEYFNNLWKRLIELDFITKIDTCVIYLTEEKFQFDILSLPDEKVVEHTSDNNLNERQRVKVQAHIRSGVSMSNEQRNRLRDFLNGHDLLLTDDTLLTLENFNQFDWTAQTIVFGYDRVPEEITVIHSPDRQEQSIITEISSLIKKERANKIHELLVKSFAEKLIENGYNPKSNKLIDLYFQLPKGEYYIFEMKTITKQNEISQIRKAIAQLYEYSFIYGLKGAILCLVLDHCPYENWILEYLVNDRKIYPCWLGKGNFNFSLNTSEIFKPLVNKKEVFTAITR